MTPALIAVVPIARKVTIAAHELGLVTVDSDMKLAVEHFRVGVRAALASRLD